MINEQSHKEVLTPPHGSTLMWLRGPEVYSIINGQWTHLFSVAPIVGEPDNVGLDFPTFYLVDAESNLETLANLAEPLIGKYTVFLDNGYEKRIASFHAGEISVLEGSVIRLYNVDFNTGEIEESHSTDVAHILLDLEIVSPESPDDTPEVIASRALNLEKLQSTLTLPFLAHMDYGIGIGRFINGAGGEINVIYATGGNGHYTINGDGSIVKDENYVPGDTYVYQGYKNAGGTKTQEEFFAELVNLIG